MWLQMEGKDARLERKRVEVEDREAALEGQIGEAAHLVLSVMAIKACYCHLFKHQLLPPQLHFSMLTYHFNPSCKPDPTLTCAPNVQT